LWLLCAVWAFTFSSIPFIVCVSAPRSLPFPYTPLVRSPLSAYVCDALPSEPVVELSVGSELELSPQSTCTFHGLSFTPGSVKEPRAEHMSVPPSLFWLVGGLPLGGTFFTTTSVVYALNP